MGDAVAWLRRRAIGLRSPLTTVIRGALRDGWAIGRGAADEVIGIRPFTDWATWRPGSPATEVGRDLQRLLDDADVTIRSVEANRFDTLAKVLADGLDDGGDIDAIAAKLRPLLRDPQWARTIAITETSRAISAAAWSTYTTYGVTKMRWEVAADDACQPCAANAAVGVVGVDDRFPSGDRHPPAHPRCRCSVLPDES